MRLWFVPLNVLVAALRILGIAREHRPLGRFYSNANREGTLPAECRPCTHHHLHLKAEGVVSLGRAGVRGRAWGGVMKKVSSCLWLAVGLVCCDWLAVFGAAWFLYIPVPKASVPAVSCHGFMQGLHGPFSESLVIQLHSWLLHSHTHTQTHTHSQHTIPCRRCLLTNMHLFSHSLKLSLIHPFIIHPAIHPTVSQVPTNLAVRQISASHVNSPLLVHLICVDHSIPLSTPPFSCLLLPAFPLSIC